MIKHLFKLIWNKKKANLLISAEIFISFVVLFAVVTMGALSIYWYNQPLGFTYNDVWLINIDTRLSFDSTYNEVKKTTIRQLLLAIQQLPEIEDVATWALPPYSNQRSTWANDANGRRLVIRMHHGSENSKNVLGLQLIDGRWFEENDKSLNWTPVVINKQLVHERFGNENPIGKNPFPRGDEPPTKRAATDYRVIGVITDFRQDGEFSEPTNVCIEHLDIEKTTQAVSSYLLIKVKPGTTAIFKEKLDKTMESTAKGWSFDIKTLEEMRTEDFKPRISFMITVGLIAGFLLLMVALGLIGVLWQNVSRRTNEIGLRRALGSSANEVYWQILGELIVLTTFGLLIGTVIIIQFPLLNLITMIPANIYLIGLLISTTLMYLLTVMCGLYPSWLAMDIQPAEALHYE